MEELLTQKEISAILLEATNPIYQLDYFWHPTFYKLQIYCISKKGLIFIHGDKDTGMKHFQDRHSILSRKLYVRKDNNKIDNPTKFTLAPIEYAKVADIIYTASNLDVEGNKRPDLFDVYNGDYLKEGKSYNYKLIVYKYTGIVHTFFLTNKFFTRKKAYPLRRGGVSHSYNTMSCVSEYRFKYFDISDEIKFKVLLISNPVNQQELWGLEVYKNKEPFFTHIIKTEPIGSQLDTAFRMTQLEFQELPGH